MSRQVLTQKGFEKFKQEITELKNKRVITVDHLKKAREMGDLSENGYYKAAKFELGNIDRRIRELTRLTQNAEIAISKSSDTVEVGSTVSLETNNERVIYQIVGSYEADPSLGTISSVSPLGTLLLNKRKGETISLKTSKGAVLYKIVAIT